MLGRSLALSLVLGAIAGCQNAKPPPLAVAATHAIAATLSSTAPPDEIAMRAGDPLASLRLRGALHGEAIRVPAGKHPERWLAFLGTPQMARAAWLVTPETNELAPVEGWPVGVRVVGSTVRDGVVFLILETVSVLDQPAGLRAVWFESFGNFSPRMLAPASTFLGVRDVPELERRLDESIAPASFNAPLFAALRVAAKNEGTLEAALPIGGADVYDVWQSSFVRRVDHLEPGSLASSPRAQDFLVMVRDAVKNDHCEGETCEVHDHASVRLGDDAGRWLIRAITEDAPPPRTKTRVAPRSVAPSETTTSTAEVLAEQVRTVREILGQAPLVESSPIGEAQASIGVAITDLEHDGAPTVTIKDGTYARVFTLASMAAFAARNADARFEVRFADIDGDARTDVVVRATGRASDASAQTLTRVFLAPPPSVQATELAVDHASDLAVLSSATIDEAVAAALLYAIDGAGAGVSIYDACNLLKGASTVAAFRVIATPDARLLRFDAAEMPTYRARVVTAAGAKPADVKEIGERCRDLECSATRPYCAHADGFSEHYWFTGTGDLLKLAGAAFYSGP